MADEVLSVSSLTSLIRGQLEYRFSEIWVEGEISNHRLPGSGHHYFTLKDSGAQLACVLFRGAAAKHSVELSDGMQVQVFGNVSVYEARGQYQLIAQTVQPKGFGDLQAKFEALKRKLDEEGLFDPARKKAIPAFPTTVGVVTSPTGAAIRDMINVFRRRAPWIHLLIEPVRVQGEGAAEEVAAGIERLANDSGVPRPDLIIIARGGGSIEDLWSFNEEIVARAIAACPIPVMSGVGHEIDFTITDFVADRREPTPSAAAENATPDGAALRRHLEMLVDSLGNQVESEISNRRRTTDSLRRELEAREPKRKLQSWAQTLDFLSERHHSLVVNRLRELEADVQNLEQRLQSIQPLKEIIRFREVVDQLGVGLKNSTQRALSERRRHVDSVAGMMQSLSPQSVLSRGYSLTTDREGNLVHDSALLSVGDRIVTRFSKGSAESTVTETNSEESRS